jgi:hypothetical protein
MILSVISFIGVDEEKLLHIKNSCFFEFSAILMSSMIVDESEHIPASHLVIAIFCIRRPARSISRIFLIPSCTTHSFEERKTTRHIFHRRINKVHPNGRCVPKYIFSFFMLSKKTPTL